MSQGLWFLLLLGFVCLFSVALVLLMKLAARRGVTRWRFFGRWVVFYGILALYLGFLSVGIGERTVSGELLLKVAVFSCIFGAILGLLHWGVGSLPVAWQVCVRWSMFCCLMVVLIILFAVGVRDMNSVREMFLKVLIFAVLLKLLLGFFIGEQSNMVLQRSLRVLDFVLFICIMAVFFFFVSLGAKHLGLSWLWFSNDDVLTAIRTFLFILIYQGVKAVCVKGKAFLKKVVLMGC